MSLQLKGYASLATMTTDIRTDLASADFGAHRLTIESGNQSVLRVRRGTGTIGDTSIRVQRDGIRAGCGSAAGNRLIRRQSRAVRAGRVEGADQHRRATASGRTSVLIRTGHAIHTRVFQAVLIDRGATRVNRGFDGLGAVSVAEASGEHCR